MPQRPKAAFLDFAASGPNIDTRALDRVVDVSYFPYSRAAEVTERIRDAEVVLVNKAKIDAATIAASKRLRLVAVVATGTDNVDCAAAKQHGVTVTNIRDYCSTAVTQHVFALILGLTQQIGGYAA